MLFTLGLKELPFEQKEDQIIYIENEYDKKVNRYIQKNYDAIRKHFHSRGFSFIYIPKRLEEIRRAEVVAFNAPYAKPKDEVTIGSDFLLEYMVHPENRNNIPPSLIYYNPYKRDSDYKEAIIQYRGIELTPESGYTKTSDLFNILNEIKNDLIQPLIALIDSQETYSEQPHISIENKAIEPVVDDNVLAHLQFIRYLIAHHRLCKNPDWIFKATEDYQLPIIRIVNPNAFHPRTLLRFHVNDLNNITLIKNSYKLIPNH